MLSPCNYTLPKSNIPVAPKKWWVFPIGIFSFSGVLFSGRVPSLKVFHEQLKIAQYLKLEIPIPRFIIFGYGTF